MKENEILSDFLRRLNLSCIFSNNLSIHGYGLGPHPIRNFKHCFENFPTCARGVFKGEGFALSAKFMKFS
jgi:hypothetical protein